MAVYNLGSVIGPPGEKGDKGDKGDRGDPGAAATIAEVNSSTATPFTGVVTGYDGHLYNYPIESEITSSSTGLQRIPTARAVYDFAKITRTKIFNTRTAVGGVTPANQFTATLTANIADYLFIDVVFAPFPSNHSLSERQYNHIFTSWDALTTLAMSPIVYYTSTGSGSSYTTTLHVGGVAMGKVNAQNPNLLRIGDVIALPDLELVEVWGYK